MQTALVAASVTSVVEDLQQRRFMAGFTGSNHLTFGRMANSLALRHNASCVDAVFPVSREETFHICRGSS